jgi:hypothetical protein
MFYPNSQYCAFSMAAAVETYDLQTWKFPLLDSKDGSGIDYAIRYVHIRRQNQITSRNTQFNKFNAMAAAERLEQIREDARIDAEFAGIQGVGEDDTTGSATKEKPGCMKAQRRRVRFAVNDEAITGYQRRKNIVVRFRPKATYIPTPPLSFKGTVIMDHAPDHSVNQRLGHRVCRDLENPVLLKVVGRFIAALEAFLGTEEMMCRRLVQANTVANIRLGIEAERKYREAALERIAPRHEAKWLQYVDLWDEARKENRKCRLAEIVRVKEVARVDYCATEDRTREQRVGFGQVRIQDKAEKLGEYETRLRTKSDHSPLCKRRKKPILLRY